GTVLHNQRRDGAMCQEIDEDVVRIEADKFDFVGDVVLGDRLARAPRHDQVGRKNAAQLGLVGDQVGHDVQAGRRHAVGNLVGDEFQARIFGCDLLLNYNMNQFVK